MVQTGYNPPSHLALGIILDWIFVDFFVMTSNSLPFGLGGEFAMKVRNQHDVIGSLLLSCQLAITVQVYLFFSTNQSANQHFTWSLIVVSADRTCVVPKQA